MMKGNFNLAEVFEIAVQIERNGAAFYRRAAERLQDKPELKELLVDLANQEEAHEGLFDGIRRHFADKTSTPELEDEMTQLYLDAVADGIIFERKKDDQFLSYRDWNVEDIFRMAMYKEKDSIMFYLGVKAIMPEPENKKIMDYLIHEEQRHFAVLNFNLQKLKGSAD